MFTQSSTTPHNRDTNKKLVKILHNLLEMDETAPFRRPVPHKALGLGDYKKIIKKPIDLNQIRRQNNQSKYKTIEEALDDIDLCWQNCKLYNHASSQVYQQAQNLQRLYWKMVKQNFPQIYALVQPRIQDVEGGQLQSHQIPQLSMHQPQSSPQVPQMSSNPNQPQSKPTIPKIANPIHSQQQSSNKAQSQFSHQKMQQQAQPQLDHQPQPYNEHEPYNEPQNQQSSPQQKQPHLPIQVNLTEHPSPEALQRLNHHMSGITDRAIFQQVLEVLFTYEKDNMIGRGRDKDKGDKGERGQMRFKMDTIHISTYWRICRIVGLGGDDIGEIIQ